MQRAIHRLFKEINPKNETYRVTLMDDAGFSNASLINILNIFRNGNAAVKLLNPNAAVKFNSFFKQINDYNYRPAWRKHPAKKREEQPYRIHPVTGNIEQNPYSQNEQNSRKNKEKTSIKKNSFTLLNSECTTSLFYSECAIVVDFSQVALKQAFKADGHSNFRWWYGEKDELEKLKENGGKIDGWPIISDILITGKNEKDQRKKVYKYVNSTTRPNEVLIEPTQASLSCILITNRNQLNKAKEFREKSGFNLPIILYQPHGKKLCKSILINKNENPLVNKFNEYYRKELSENKNTPFFGLFRGTEWKNYKNPNNLEEIFTHAFLENGNRSKQILHKLGWISVSGKVNYKNSNLTAHEIKSIESAMTVIEKRYADIKSKKNIYSFLR